MSLCLLVLFFTFAADARAWTVTERDACVAMSHGAELHHISVTAEDTVDLRFITFTSKRCGIRILDQASPGSAKGMDAAARGVNAIGAINGGFFDKQFQPMGLYVVDGQRSGSLSRSSLLGGVLLQRGGKLQLVWRDEYQEGATGVTQLLQTGPRLVNGGKAVQGLDTKASRPRSFILTDGAGQWAIGVARYCTLAELAQILSTAELLPQFKVARALNFDGGRSTGLWALQADGSTLYESPMTTVRNYIAIVPKE
jgi:uncharacterized protein YigE (DUF2233 family)